MITITPDFSRWDAALAVLGSEQAGKAFMRGINRTSANAKVAMTKVIAEDLSMQQKGVRDEIRVQKATTDELTSTVYATSKRIPLIYFSARGPEPSGGKGRGVTAKTRAKKYPHAFIATVTGPKGGTHRGVFARKSTLTRRSAGARGLNLPIYELTGPSIYQVFKNNEDVARARAMEMLVPNVQHEIGFLLQQAKQ